MHKLEVINFEDLNEYEFPQDELFEFCINKNLETFYFKLKYNKNNTNLLILSNGAINKKKRKPPVYMRSNWADDFEANCLFIDDKTVHDISINIGWGFGRENRFYIEDYSEIVIELCKKFNFKSEAVFYYGSSAGGFMSTMLAILHKGSTAIVNNPQMFVFQYDERAVNSFYSKVLPNFKKTDIKRKYLYRLSTISLMRIKKNIPRLFYIQNRAATDDMDKQVTRFQTKIKNYELDNSKIQYLFYYDEELGHSPLGKTESVNLVNRIMNHKNLL